MLNGIRMKLYSNKKMKSFIIKDNHEACFLTNESTLPRKEIVCNIVFI